METVTQGFPQKNLGDGEFSLDQSGMALFCTAERTHQLIRCQVIHYSTGMLKLSGMEHTGYERTGASKYKPQEWYVRIK